MGRVRDMAWLARVCIIAFHALSSSGSTDVLSVSDYPPSSEISVPVFGMQHYMLVSPAGVLHPPLPKIGFCSPVGNKDGSAPSNWGLHVLAFAARSAIFLHLRVLNKRKYRSKEVNFILL